MSLSRQWTIKQHNIKIRATSYGRPRAYWRYHVHDAWRSLGALFRGPNGNMTWMDPMTIDKITHWTVSDPEPANQQTPMIVTNSMGWAAQLPLLVKYDPLTWKSIKIKHTFWIDDNNVYSWYSPNATRQGMKIRELM